ncbi:MAG: dihydroorotase [Candidatus Aminicenantes bacterium]|nr:dihydroorotase [Candidatus Aminicenantes bacterium]
MKLLLKNARLLDPASNLDGYYDLLLAAGQVVEIKEHLQVEADREYDLRGCLIVPGFIDLHTHLREPGYEHKETIATGTRAAARGGFTTVCCMPNTSPVNDSPEVTEWIINKARKEGVVNVLPIAAITLGQKGQELVEMDKLKEAGAIAFSDDGQPLLNSQLMRTALARAAEIDSLIIDHCEEKSLVQSGVINEGKISRQLGMPGMPSAAEEIMVARDIILAKNYGFRVHLAHLSTRGSVELLALAKASGAPVTAEVTPHHLLLTEDELLSQDPDLKVNPPLRTAEDVQALRQAFKSGLIDIIATDHAPHAPEEKALGLEKAPFGINGLETAVPALLEKLVKTGEISLARLVEALSLKPARLLGLDRKGTLRPGADADLTVLNLEKNTLITKETFASRSFNTPYKGKTLQARVVLTIVAGQVVYSSLES